MRIPRVYIGTALAEGDEVALDRAQGHYLTRVLRLKPGAAFFLFNGIDGFDYRAGLRIDGRRVVARIDTALPLTTESSLDSHVIQGLGRSDHVDWTIQKTTELGVRRVTIFNAERSQSPLKQAQVEKKLAHWRGVAISACEQCGRALLPRIEFHDALKPLLENNRDALRLLLNFGGETLAGVLREQDVAGSVSILLGPEGGLTQPEIDAARDAGYRPVTLGARVLRTETAATAALAILQFELGDI